MQFFTHVVSLDGNAMALFNAAVFLSYSFRFQQPHCRCESMRNYVVYFGGTLVVLASAEWMGGTERGGD